MSLEPYLFQAKQTEVSQPFFIGEVLQPFLWPSSGLSHTVSCLSVLRTPEVAAVLQVESRENRVEGEDDLSCPAGDAFFDAAQKAIGFLSWERTLLAHS